ncbi:MAG: multidrug ABC transporter [Atopobiaceae bacterium]|nr:multidrug ABC transporter [Atopobiaceae bacterium]
MLASVLIALFGVFISSISQVMLKKSAMAKHDSALGEYLNPLVIGAYALFVGATLCSVIAFRQIPLSMGPILDATGYFYVVLFGITIFHEKIDRTKILALAIIIAGVLIYSSGV